MFVATSWSVGAYDTTLFTMHAAQHMLLQMLAPVPLAAPITLALRTLPRGGRSAVLSVMHSRPSRLLTHPLVAYGIFVVSPFVLCYSLSVRGDVAQRRAARPGARGTSS